MIEVEEHIVVGGSEEEVVELIAVEDVGEV